MSKKKGKRGKGVVDCMAFLVNIRIALITPCISVPGSHGLKRMVSTFGFMSHLTKKEKGNIYFKEVAFI